MFFVFFITGVPDTLIEISKEKWLITTQRKNERLRGRKYKYKENYFIEVNSMHGVSEYEPKKYTFELVKKGKEKRFDNASKEITQFKMKIKI